MKLVTFAKTELRNLFSTPATRPYPQQPREYTERYRGHIENDMDLCIFCSLCARRCPTGAIQVDRTARTWSISPYSCIQCGYCVEGCPKKCLSMKQTYTQPGPEKTTKSFEGPPAPTKPAVPVKPATPAAAAKPAAPAKEAAPTAAKPVDTAEPEKKAAPAEKENS